MPRWLRAEGQAPALHPCEVHESAAGIRPTFHRGLVLRLRFGSFELDEDLFELRCSGMSLSVQPRVLDTIVYLVRNRHRLVTRDDLVSGPWRGTVVTDAAISQAIKQARRVLGQRTSGTNAIQTVRGKGFRFVLAVTAVPVPVDPAFTTTSSQPPRRSVAELDPEEAPPKPARSSVSLGRSLPLCAICGQALACRNPS